jgi:hypothetical protein
MLSSLARGSGLSCSLPVIYSRELEAPWPQFVLTALIPCQPPPFPGIPYVGLITYFSGRALRRHAEHKREIGYERVEGAPFVKRQLISESK